MVEYIGAAAAQSGLSVDTIRYYDTLGLLYFADRDPAGRRRFSDDAVRWLVFLRQMRATGMPLRQLREYIEQREQGRDGVGGVLHVLREHQRAMLAARAELDDCLAMVEGKITKYEQLARTGQPPGAPQV
ncbi:MerR family transcriptional regulator [Frankia sp. AiPs1]|uniref:MerR family transcriptional regulator n=1 Tax=Frankia sp. AiPa1 TaxID=573492 RepID=UPI00202AF812|nr:MerR family transcriptional regulator [Frankia sp. AiPa1]MCL9762261.1 MerR family transcriptional regulator [Frankia sp. AiPa1]